jgi:aspartate carbamoyltransferase catalytic subunit
MGANVCIAGPATLIPNMFETKGLYVCPNIRDAVKDAQVVMALRVQTERQTNGLFPSLSEYSQLYGLRLDWLPPSGTYIVLHPGPMNRGVELNSLVADSPESCISLQVLHGVSVRMAILQKIVGGE